VSLFEPETYERAREEFLAAAEGAGLRTMRLRMPVEGMSELFIDLALCARDPVNCLLHFSGVHGIEGYCGSRIQRELMKSLPESGPSLLFVHAVNPYGMALYRRANAENVDLNRNFSAEKPENPDYRLFRFFLEPPSRGAFLPGLLHGLAMRAALGKARANQAVAGGQADFPTGLFFTGRSLQRELASLAEFLRAHLSGAQRIVAIDLHTGLGRYGQETLFADADRGEAGPAFFAKAFGRAMDQPGPENYRNHGRFSDLLRKALPGARHYFVLQEFGTLSPVPVLNALRRENFDWQRRPRNASPPPRVRDAMLAAFDPADPAWRKKTLELGCLRWREALAAMGKESFTTGA
jgi:Protein of unknown function (DUF2817)